MRHFSAHHLIEANRFGLADAAADGRLLMDICDHDCHRLGAMMHTDAVRRLDRLIAAGAWIDAALALLAIELPQWTLRRLSYDGGEWYCTLSAHREMPDWLDGAIETHHPDMATALLQAVQQALDAGTPQPPALAGPPAAADDFAPMSCDNYG